MPPTSTPSSSAALTGESASTLRAGAARASSPTPSNIPPDAARSSQAPSSNDTAHAIDMSRAASSMGACAVLVVTPYYNKCTQSGLIALHRHCRRRFLPRHLLQCSQPHGRRYDIGDLSGALKAPEHSGCQGSGRQPAKIAKTIETCADDFFRLVRKRRRGGRYNGTGREGLDFRSFQRPPEKTLAMIRACQQNDFRRAGALQRELMELIGALFCVVNPIPVKKGAGAGGYPGRRSPPSADGFSGRKAAASESRACENAGRMIQ